MSLIKVEELFFNYGRYEALIDITFKLHKGWTSIIGPNGAGKSTLLNVMNGYYKPDSGKVTILGENVHKLGAKDRASFMTTIHQQQSINFPIMCFEMLVNGRYAKRKNMNRLLDYDYRVIYKAMEETKTLGFKDKLITKLSGGEKQRIILATALAQEPKILFIDEGFSALDIKHKNDMIYCLKKQIHDEGMNVVSVIHDLNTAYQISDTVVVMKDSKVVKFGSPKEVMTKEIIEYVYETDIKFDKDFGFNLCIKNI